MAKPDRDRLHQKIRDLRKKHRQPDGSVNTSKGSLFIQELKEWMEQENASLDYEQMAIGASRSFYEAEKAYQGAEKGQGTLDLSTGEALISLSIDHAETIEMGEANQPQWLRHIVTTNTEFGRQSAAFARKSAFQGQIFENFRTGDKAKDVYRRLKAGEDDQPNAQAAD